MLEKIFKVYVAEKKYEAYLVSANKVVEDTQDSGVLSEESWVRERKDLENEILTYMEELFPCTENGATVVLNLANTLAVAVESSPEKRKLLVEESFPDSVLSWDEYKVWKFVAENLKF